MTDVPYYNNIPDGPNNPSQDQPLMKINTNAVDTLISVDHYGFNTNTGFGGEHQQVNLPQKNTPGAITDPASVVFTGNGTASTHAELLFKNQDATFLLSCVKAFGTFTQVTTLGPVAVTLDNGYNVVSISKTSSNYTVTLTPNAVKGTKPVIFVSIPATGSTSPTNTSNIAWSYSANTLSIVTNTIIIAPDARPISFVILEA